MSTIYEFFFNTGVGNIVLASVVSTIIALYIKDNKFVPWTYQENDKYVFLKRIVNAISIALLVVIVVGTLAALVDWIILSLS